MAIKQWREISQERHGGLDGGKERKVKGYIEKLFILFFVCLFKVNGHSSGLDA